jgi:hypothetical protein
MKNLKSVAETSNETHYLENRKIRIMICGDESTLGTVVSMADRWEVPI